jgi:hypothetical protein
MGYYSLLLAGAALGHIPGPSQLPLGRPALGCARIYRPQIATPLVARIACVEQGDCDAGDSLAPRRSKRLPPRGLRRLTQWLREKRQGIYLAVLSSMIFAGPNPSLAAPRRSYTPPELEQTFLKHEWTQDELTELGVDVSQFLKKDLLFKEYRLSEVEQDMFDYENAVAGDDEGRPMQIALYLALSAGLAKGAISGLQGIERSASARLATRAAHAPSNCLARAPRALPGLPPLAHGRCFALSFGRNRYSAWIVRAGGLRTGTRQTSRERSK